MKAFKAIIVFVLVVFVLFLCMVQGQGKVKVVRSDYSGLHTVENE